ncbi:coiled-coil domain-containing protein 63 [Leptopilina heterotoma]|uniref:coiled-coil domain-containing protein 63 n=1 Tax=Leptopilina heterotoma TaxID=63436 RepID=UPI001CA8E101|nr:coiled-coil domain-containing protein 63 [Leptopilina heterotoma]XP_043481678.1 coiled-coil domain-containing protein 63 [Leptopilina heterotoma]
MAYRQQNQVQDEMELEAMAEAELARLKRQYRIMENDRKSYSRKMQLQLKKQEKIIDQLEREKSELLLTIKAIKSPANLKKDEKDRAEIEKLLQKRTKYMELIEKEKQQIAELDEQIAKVSKEVNALKKKVRTDAQSKEMVMKHNKFVSILENRLEVATKKFNLTIAKNTELRKEIDGLLKERAQFNALYTKLVNKINAGKQVINDLIEQATIAFNQRDEELSKIHALRERGARDLKNHTSEMCELQRTLDNEMKLQEFLGVKGQCREMTNLNAKKDAEHAAKKKEMEDKVAEYTKILTELKEFTGEEDVDKLAANFIKQEEENFALFNYVNELNDERESLQNRVEQLRAGIEEAKALNNEEGQKQAETLEKLKQELEEETRLADEAEKELEKSQEVMNQLLKGVDELFGAIKCDKSPILELLGDDTQVTMNNVMLYLGIIEKEVSNILTKMYSTENVNGEEKISEERKSVLVPPTLSDIAPTQPCPLCSEKEEFQKVSEGLEVPMTQKEATEKLNKRLENDISELLHSVSGCNLPAARKIMQKRYQ